MEKSHSPKVPLILLSGLLSTPRLWEHQVHHLADCASIQALSSSENTSEKMIEAILRQAPPRFALAGHSMGGWLALEIMRATPTRVTKLCLLNTTARSDSEEKKLKRQEMIEQAQGGDFEEIIEQMAGKFVHQSLMKNLIQEMFRAEGAETFVHQELAILNRRESWSILPTISCPTLVIHAREDKNFSLEEHQELVDKIPKAKLAIVEDAGHMSPMEMPQAITALLRFWLNYF